MGLHAADAISKIEQGLPAMSLFAGAAVAMSFHEAQSDVERISIHVHA